MTKLSPFSSSTRPWVERPTLDLDATLPLERRLAAIDDDAIRDGRRLLEAIMAEVPSWALGIADLVRLRTGGRFHAEAVAFARRCGVAWRSVMLANVTYDLAMMFVGCTTVALPGPRGPVVARNMDWWPQDVLARTTYLLCYWDGERLLRAEAGWPGGIGTVTGLSGRGFAVVLNAVRCGAGCDRLGYPVLLFIRTVIDDAADFDDAVHRLSTQHLAAPCLLTVVGTGNDQRVVLERTPKRCCVRMAAIDEPLITTNHYHLLESPVIDPLAEPRSSCARFDGMSQFLAGYDAASEPDIERLLYYLSDPCVIQDITAQHVVIHPASGTMRLFVPRRLVEEA